MSYWRLDVAVFSEALTATELDADVASAASVPAPDANGPFYVDGSSVGGACSDARTAADAASSATPWCTLDRAVEASPLQGGTVLVRGGTYPRLTITSFSRAGQLIIRAFRGEQPRLQGLKVTNSSRLAIEGFRIDEVTELLGTVRDLTLRNNDISPRDVFVENGEDLLFEDNHIHDLEMATDPDTKNCIPPRCGYGIRIVKGKRVTFRRNLFRVIPADGIQAGEAVDYEIVDNTFDDIRVDPTQDPDEHSDAIQFYRNSQNLLISGNTFRGTRGPLIQESCEKGDPPGTFAHHGLRIENNVFVRQRDFALKICNAPGLRLLNNTAWDPGQAVSRVIITTPYMETDQTTAVVAANNIIEEFRATDVFDVEDYNLIGDGPRAGSHDLAGPPYFADPAADDYRLVGGSPGIDAGTSGHGAPARDRDNAVRHDTPTIANSGGGPVAFYDMGAYEFNASYTPPSGTYHDVVLATPGLASYWRLGERSGVTAADVKGGRNGTYTNGVALGTVGALAAADDTAAHFDGIDDSVTLPAIPASVDFTIEGWQRMDGTTNNTTLYGKFGRVRVMPRPSGFYVDVWVNGMAYFLQESGAPNVDEWVHWAVVRSGSTLRVFRNAVNVMTRSDLPPATAADISGDIGRIGDRDPAAARIDEVAVYSRGLSVSELLARVVLAALVPAPANSPDPPTASPAPAPQLSEPPRVDASPPPPGPTGDHPAGPAGRVIVPASVMRMSLRTNGLPVRFSCAVACAVDARVTVDASTARRLGIRPQGRTVTLGRATARRRRAGAGVLRVRLTRRARQAFGRRRRVALSVHTEVRAGGTTLLATKRTEVRG